MGWTLVGHWKLPPKYELLHLARDDANGLPSHWRRKVVPKIWYFAVNTGAVFFLPFLSIYWRQKLGFTTQQIGLLQALRPWVNAASGYLLAPLADAWDIHYVMLLCTYAVTIISRGLLTLHWEFGMTLLWALVMEGAVSPMGTLVDATVVAGSTKDGTYGRARLWASVGWGGLAPVAGAIIGKFGIHTSFMVFAAIYAAAFIPTALIPVGLLGTKYTKRRAGSSNSDSNTQQSGAEGAVQPGGEGAVPPSRRGSLTNAEDVAVTAHVQQTGVSGAAQRRRSRRSETHADSVSLDDGSTQVQHRRRSTVKSDANMRCSFAHVAADARSSAKDEVVVEITIRPGTGAAKGSQSAECDAEAASTVAGKVAAAGKEAADAVAEVEVEAGEQRENLWLGLQRLLSDIYVLTFMFKALLMGVANGFIGYLFLLLSDQGASGTLLGLCLTMNCLAEVPVFYFSGALIKKLKVEWALNLAMAAYCLRLVAYALIPYYPTVWLVLPVELLQGLTFALAWSAGTVHCRRIAPKHLRSTVQSIFSGLYSGVGAGLGGLAGGLLYGSFGGQVMCEVGVGILLAGWILANSANLAKMICSGMRGGLRGMQSMGSAILHRATPPPQIAAPPPPTEESV